ncbi:hypothetical protein AB4Y32_05595 [Paraburkholderia phymatum]|uniref:Uncharacterized protein n=1 Tax=Paraburkholderia phymatum TaxID=148447 RepID=A0ACC6TV84_9BURK
MKSKIGECNERADRPFALQRPVRTVRSSQRISAPIGAVVRFVEEGERMLKRAMHRPLARADAANALRLHGMNVRAGEKSALSATDNTDAQHLVTRVSRPEGRYVVDGASNPTVTSRARPGHCWSYSRSQLQSRIFRSLNVARRALPSTTLPIYVRRMATRVALEMVSN